MLKTVCELVAFVIFLLGRTDNLLKMQTLKLMRTFNLIILAQFYAHKNLIITMKNPVRMRFPSPAFVIIIHGSSIFCSQPSQQQHNAEFDTHVEKVISFGFYAWKTHFISETRAEE